MTFKVDLTKQTEYDELLRQGELKEGLPDGALKLVMMIENRNNPNPTAVSPMGAQGLMQIMPANQKTLGVTDPNDPAQSISAAAALMGDAYRRYDGNIGAAIADYNGGPRAAERYIKGEAMHPETTDYLRFAQDYINGKASTYGNTIVDAGGIQAKGVAPSDAFQGDEGSLTDYITGLNEEDERKLQEEAKLYDLSVKDSISMGFASTVTNALFNVAGREEDSNFVLSDSDYSNIATKFPQGLAAGQEARIRNSRSASDLANNIDRISQENDFSSRMQHQTGIAVAGHYAALFGAGMADPVALPLGTFGAAGRLVRGGGVVASSGRMAMEGAAGAGISSLAVQQADKGHVSSEELMINLGAGAMFGAGLGALAGRSDVPGKVAMEEELMRTMQGRVDGSPEYSPRLVDTGSDGLAVNFNEARVTSTGSAGEIVGAGPTSVIAAANSWDESATAAVQAVRERRQSWYGSDLRKKLSGWADSEGVRLANSESKVARWVGSMWAGDAAGLGKQSARNVAVIKEQNKDLLNFEFIPAVRDAFESSLDTGAKLRYGAGMADSEQATWSREVQLERFRHRMYRVSNEGSSKGYVSEAPAHVQRGAAALDSLYAKSKQMHLAADTEHAAQLKTMDSVGYIEQRPDYIKINKADPETREAFLSMVKDDYRAEATAKVNLIRKGREEWVLNQTAKVHAEATAANAGGKPRYSAEQQQFLRDPGAHFDKYVDELSSKIHREMEVRASHWWENALRDPEARYQNSEASLITLAREMSGEWFTGRVVDEELVNSFQKTLTERWADTSRRELNMLNNRIVNGNELYLLDMFQHDVFSATVNTINDTSARVAFAKLGWKTEQDIADTLSALAHSGATPTEQNAAKAISDQLLNRGGSYDNNPLMQTMSNLTHSSMMGKLGLNVLADLPTAISNLGVGGMMDALGTMGKHAIDGTLFVKNGRLTKLGSDLDFMTRGMMGHDYQLHMPRPTNADGFAMEAGGTLLRVSQRAANATNHLSGANIISKWIGEGVTQATNRRLHKALRTGKGISESRLADIGIHGKTAERIQKQFSEHSTSKDFGLDKWTDPLAREELISAAWRLNQQGSLARDSAGSLPEWTRNNVLGVLLSKFRAIGIKAQERILVRNLTLADGNMVAMMTAGLAWATFLAYARIHADAAVNKDGRKVLKERLTPIGMADMVTRMASVLGGSSEVTNLLQLMTGGAVHGSDTPLTGAVQVLPNFIGKVGEAATGNAEWSDAAGAGIQLLPGANTYQMLLLKKAIQE
ncbi:lytic transglycosylase [Pectobacterium phage PP2]|uniref:Lytic transglycosylase n=1 Tax=Pectobacterium phage PP2 TaxID=1897743 RepID=A0A1W5P516_9CAUD|nr:lytic transglycosylase [Pectobacterium phage PP2]AOT25405.1 lytic transglycosylase [Pectobacterium phage PP2]